MGREKKSIVKKNTQHSVSLSPDELTEKIPLPFVILSADGKILNSNKKAQELLSGWRENLGMDLLETGFMKDIIAGMQKGNIYNETQQDIGGGTYLFSVTYHFDPVKNASEYFVIFRDISRNVKLAEDLRRSQEDYRNLLESLPDVIWRVDSDLRFTYLSPQVEQMFGYKPSDLIGKKLTDYLYDDDERRRVAERLEAAFRGEFKEPQMKASFCHKEGRLVFIESSFHLIRDDNGKIVGVNGAARNVTYRKMIEDNLRRLAAVYQNATEAIFLFDRNANIISGNAKFYEFYIRNPENTLGRTIYETICLPEDIEATKQVVEGVFQGKRFNREWTDVRPDGSKVYVSTTIFPINSDGLKVLYGVSMNHDITDRVELERNLVNSEKRYRSLADNVNDIIYSYDNKGRFITANKFALNILGISESEIRGKLPSDIMPASMSEAIEKNVRKVIRNKRPLHVEEKINMFGKERFLITEISPILDEKGNLMQVAGVSHDVTEIVEARRRAEEANRMKSEFFANVSHEIRTPLNAAIGFAYLIKQLLQSDKGKPGEIKEKAIGYADAIEESGRSLSRVLEDILNMARIEAGKINIVKDKFSLRDLVVTQVNIFKKQAEEKSLLYTFSMDADDYILHSDRARLGQIILNLVGNAVKFTDSGSVKVAAFGEKDGSVRLDVIDTGIGISSNETGNIFEPFIQAGAGSELKYGGSGLGLTISKRLCDLLGFAISYKSRLNKGTTFTVTIPRETVIRAVKTPEQAEDNGGRSRPVLIIEEDEASFQSLKEYIESHGLVVMRAHDGAEALDLASTNNYKAVFMDLKAPKAESYETLEKLRKIKGYKKVPVYAVSENDGKSSRERCLEKGFDDFISGPSSDTLRLIVSRLAAS
ncbi:MAG: PAS domain S-box protein [Chloroflexi bacterium]|nr:PAS domain S-box protein [Chloroflexota bacterium]